MSLRKDIPHKLEIKPQADRYLGKLSKKNNKDFKILLKFIDDLSKNPYNSINLKDSVEKERRVRKGDYRLIFIIDAKNKEISITKIGKRSNIYNKLLVSI